MSKNISKITVVANSDDKKLLVSEYTTDILSACSQDDKISESIVNNLMFTKLIRENFAEFKDAKFIDIVAYALKRTFNVENVTAELFSRNYNLRHVILERIAEKTADTMTAQSTATATADTTANISEDLMKSIQAHRDANESLDKIQATMFDLMKSKQLDVTKNDVIAHIFEQKMREKRLAESKVAKKLSF